MSYFNNGTSAEVLEENNFYPFGLKHEGYNAQIGNPSYNYQYNGKELQKETGWSDYGARMYMSDIGRWGMIDPLADQYRRLTPYNYAANNPIMFIDPDGRKIQAPRGDVDPLGSVSGSVRGGMMDYYAQGGTGSTSDLLKFLGQEDNMGAFFAALHGGGGGSTAGGMTFTSPYMIAFIQQGISQPGFINGLFSLAEQLEKAGFKDAANTKAKFSDVYSLVEKVPALAELYEKTTNGGFKLKFGENFNLKAPGKGEFNDIEFNMTKIKNLLDYAFTIGHEMTHSFTDLHFRSRFFELYDNRNGQQMRDNTYSFFKEVVGVGWEINYGETRYGGLNDVNAARKYYPQIMKEAKDQIEPHLKFLQREWQKVYNSK